jgi:hypothetical protein
MTHEAICSWLQANKPKAIWNLRGVTYEGLEWLDLVQTKPTAQEIGL